FLVVAVLADGAAVVVSVNRIFLAATSSLATLIAKLPGAGIVADVPLFMLCLRHGAPDSSGPRIHVVGSWCLVARAAISDQFPGDVVTVPVTCTGTPPQCRSWPLTTRLSASTTPRARCSAGCWASHSGKTPYSLSEPLALYGRRLGWG